MHARQARTATSAKGKTGDADTIDATPDDVETLGDEVGVYFCPGEPRSDFDGLLFLVDNDVVKIDHRDLDTMG